MIEEVLRVAAWQCVECNRFNKPEDFSCDFCGEYFSGIVNIRFNRTPRTSKEVEKAFREWSDPFKGEPLTINPALIA